MSTVLRLVRGQLFSPLFSDLNRFQRGIKGKLLRSSSPPLPKPAPYPYTSKRYTRYHALFDKTSSRMDENSKIIVIEGPIAAGKTKLAKALAEDLGMFHMPEANLDMWLTNEYGYNFKDSDPQLPEIMRSFDVQDFLLNPKHVNVANFQIMQYRIKYSQYFDALAHLLSTGQGVVLERCPFSDFVFLETMVHHDYISKTAKSVYYDVRKNTLFQLLKPHLVIYLDVSVDKVLEKIQKRGVTAEIQSKVLTPKYLEKMEDVYKQSYLKDISINSELLVYDWNEEGDMEIVVEDIERISFTREGIHDPKLEDWEFEMEEDWRVARTKYCDFKDRYLDGHFMIPRFDAPELLADAEDLKRYYDVFDHSPGNMYHYGYNANMGDNTLFAVWVNHRRTLPLIERKFA